MYKSCCRRVELEIAGQTKKTGSSNRLSPMFNEDMEFVLDGPASKNAKLKVEVWDRRWINDFKVKTSPWCLRTSSFEQGSVTDHCSTWYSSDLFGLQGGIEISLDALKEEKRVMKTWQLQGTEDKIGPGQPLPEVEMNVRWAGFLDVPT
jgi:hypothetical protein